MIFGSLVFPWFGLELQDPSKALPGIALVYFGLRDDETSDFVWSCGFLLNCVFARARLQILASLCAAL